MADVKQQARKEAERILATVWAHGSSSYSFPVDPALIAKQLGVRVYEQILDPSVSGAIIKEVEGDPTILLNASDPDNRKRFTCAHEIGHFVKNSQNLNSAREFEYVDLRSTLATQGTDPNEIFANEFAANLLMPAEYVKQGHREKQTTTELAYRFGVSTEAIQYRMRNLKLS